VGTTNNGEYRHIFFGICAFHFPAGWTAISSRYYPDQFNPGIIPEFFQSYSLFTKNKQVSSAEWASSLIIGRLVVAN